MRIVEIFDTTQSNPDFSYMHRPLALRQGLRDAGVQVDEVWLWDMLYKRPPIRRLKNAALIRERLRGADLIIGNMSIGAAVAGLAGRGLGIPIVYDVHTYWITERRAVWKMSRTRRNLTDYVSSLLIEPTARRHADHFLVVSNAARRIYELKGVPSDRITLVRNGIEPELFPFTPLPPEGRRRIVYGGAVTDYQGVPFMTEAFSDLIRRKPDVAAELYLVGFGLGYEARREWCEKMGSGRILTHGYAPREEFVRELQTAHWGTMAFPPAVTRLRRDAFPYKFAEYLALGRPVVMTDSNETAEMCRESQTGIVVPPSLPALADAYEQAATLPRADLEAMAERGRDYVASHLTWRHMQEAMYGAFRKLGLQIPIATMP